MNNSKKLLLLSLLPGLLTVMFILYVLVPAISKIDNTKQNLESEKAAYTDTQNKIDSFKANNRLFNEVQDLKATLADFDIKVPPKDELAIFLYDVEKFAGASKIKVSSVTTKAQNPVEIIDPAKVAKENATANRKKKKTDVAPANLVEIPMEIMVIGYYPDVINFIKTLEAYQRRVMINGVMVSNFRDDKDKAVPRVQMTIDCSVYSFFKQPEELLTSSTDANNTNASGTVNKTD